MAVSPPLTPPQPYGKGKSVGCNGRTVINLIERDSLSVTSVVRTPSALAEIPSCSTDMSTETRWDVCCCDVGGGTADDCLNDDKDYDVVPVMFGATRVATVLNFDKSPLAKHVKASSKTSNPWLIDCLIESNAKGAAVPSPRFGLLLDPYLVVENGQMLLTVDVHIKFRLSSLSLNDDSENDG